VKDSNRSSIFDRIPVWFHARDAPDATPRAPTRNIRRWTAYAHICAYLGLRNQLYSSVLVLLAARVRDLTTGTVILETPACIRRYWRSNEHRWLLAVTRTSTVIGNRDLHSKSTIERFQSSANVENGRNKRVRKNEHSAK